MRSTGVSGCRRTRMMGNHDFLKRITKSLYYGKLPSIPCLSLPVMELSADVFSESHKGKSLKRLYIDDAAELTRNACISPCSLVLALLYLERLKTFNPDYVANIAPAELFLVSLMVSNKFLQDDGEEDEVFTDEWATSAGISSVALNQLERKFLHAIDWRVFVNESQFETTLEWLEHQISLRQAKLRGWFTYTDLANINNTVESIGLMKCLVTVYIALSVSYLASVYTLVASSFIVSQSLLTLTSTNHIMNAFGCINPTDRLTNTTNTSYIYNTIVDGVPEIDSTSLLEEPSNLRFLEDNRNFIINNHNQRMSQQLSGIQNSGPLYVSFLRNFIQSSLLNECANGSKKGYSYEETNLNGINESTFPSTCKSRFGCIASDMKWINFWTKPVLC